MLRAAPPIITALNFRPRLCKKISNSSIMVFIDILYHTILIKVKIRSKYINILSFYIKINDEDMVKVASEFTDQADDDTADFYFVRGIPHGFHGGVGRA
nr:hypothetical protein HAGR004_36040 [Bdellovibrio sp. HAGR004]